MKRGFIMAYENPIPNLDDIIASSTTDSEMDYKPLKEVYFAFIDVLGFKKTFDDMKISQKDDIADKYKDVFNYYFALMNASKFMSKGDKNRCYAGQTSDSLYFYTERPDYLLQFIKIFSHFSLYAMSKNVFFRGGIAKGTLYMKEMHQFYGDSVIGAYLVESNVSKRPIIVIDEKTHLDMEKVPGYKEIMDDKQGRHYIKPFKFLNEKISLDIDEKFELRGIDCKEIERNILENKEAFEYDPNNYSKYTFLLDEFNESNK